MRKTFLLFFLLSLCMFSSFTVYTVKAQSFDVMEVPTYIDNQLGCGTFIAGLIASIAVLMLTLLPTITMTRGKQHTLYIVLFFTVLAPLTGLGWFPVWLYIILLLAIALGLGDRISSMLGGLRK